MICPWDLVIVHWLDAHDSDNGWIDLTTYKAEPRTVITIGYVIPDCLEGHLTITASFFPDELPNLKGCGMLTHIPNGMLKHTVHLQQPDVPG